MTILTSASLATTTRPTLLAPRAPATRTVVAVKASRRDRARIALAVITSLAAVAATSGIVVMITMLPADDFEVITGLIALMN